MNRCIRCHRPLKRATEIGMGEVCARLAKPPAPPPKVERDLLGFNVEAACAAAMHSVNLHVEVGVEASKWEIRQQAKRQRKQLWAIRYEPVRWTAWSPFPYAETRRSNFQAAMSMLDSLADSLLGTFR